MVDELRICTRAASMTMNRAVNGEYDSCCIEPESNIKCVNLGILEAHAERYNCTHSHGT